MAPTPMIQTARKPIPTSSIIRPRTVHTDRVGAKKRGWPKGKPRKGPNGRQVTKAKKKGNQAVPKFPLMKLPLELRRNIYSLVLPKEEKSRSSGWANIVGTPNEFMNLLLVNKQVSEEARSVLYGLNTFTMVISEARTLLLGSYDTHDFLPLPTKPSLPFIENWQIALWPSHMRMVDRPDARFHDAVFSACSELAKTPDLKTLKLSIPCLCEHFENSLISCSCPRVNGRCHCDRQEIEDIHDAFINILVPFNQLRFKGKVQIVATAKPPAQRWSNNALSYPTRFPRDLSDDKRGYIQLSNLPHQQCQEPLCISFAASFDPVTTLLMGNTTPLTLTEDQVDWLDLKKRIDEEKDHPQCLALLDKALPDLWEALDSGSEEYFWSVSYRVRQHILRLLPCGTERENELWGMGRI
ncbi:MAG: hypothetical protein L6R38_003510 [Xanthoria sp. 2 TBL-2021]|nr:MAG: hypothetical protein L6R38_003510 [Xanthoria sp. 2 TBL-2021]